MTQISSRARLAALRRTGLLDTPPEIAFDRLTSLAAAVLGTPIALVSLIDEEREFFKSAVGLPDPLATARQLPLSSAICRHEVETGEPLAIDDARVHPLLRYNASVARLGIVAYAGAPLTTGDGQVIGALCVIDREARAWSARDLEMLAALAASVGTEIEIRLAKATLREQNPEAIRQLAGGIAHDFNNLLTVIKAHARFALDGLPPGEPARADLEAVREAATSAVDLTRQLLTFGRTEELQPMVPQLDEMAADILPDVGNLAGDGIAVAAQITLGTPHGESETILVVEDEDVLRRVVQRILERQGYTVHVAADGVDALRVLREREGQIDLVLTDVILPEMNGAVLAAHLAIEWPRTKVLFMSGYANDEVFQRGLLAPGTTLLRKPFTLDEMARMVRGALAGTYVDQLAVTEHS